MSLMTIVAIGPRVTDKTDKTPGRSGRFVAEATAGASGSLGPDGARSGRPVGAEPRVEVEAHRGIIVYFIRRWSRYWFSETNALHASRNSRAA